MPRLILGLIVAVAAVTCFVEPALADRAAAREAFKRGRQFFKAGQYAKAVEELKKAYKLEPHPALLRYLGQTYYKMNKARLAIDYFKRYLKAAPQAPDRAAVAAKVKQLELVVGASDEPTEDPKAQPPPKEKPPEEKPPAEKPPADINLAPTGEDEEMPDVLGKKKQPTTVTKRADTGGTSFMTVAKWTTLALGIGGVAMGVVFNVLASKKASDLEDQVRTGCPEGQDSCGGNPEMDNPQIAYNKDHHNMIQSNKQYNTIAIISYVAGGVAAGASIALFLLDKPSKKRERRVAVAPVLQPGYYGVASEVRF